MACHEVKVKLKRMACHEVKVKPKLFIKTDSLLLHGSGTRTSLDPALDKLLVLVILKTYLTQTNGLP
jgi:hypothetical protein